MSVVVPLLLLVPLLWFLSGQRFYTRQPVRHRLSIVIVLLLLVTAGCTVTQDPPSPPPPDNDTVEVEEANKQDTTKQQRPADSQSDEEAEKDVTTEQTEESETTSSPPPDTSDQADDKPTKPEAPLTAHFIDVGQGDAILIQLPNGHNILIDAGDNGKGPVVVDYLARNGIYHIDYLVATHPHADHIGGMPDIIRSFSIGEVYMPRVSHTTQTYEQFLLALRQKGLRITEVTAGLTLLDTTGLKVMFVGPVTSYNSLNDWSAVLRIEFGTTAFLFTGDAEAASERDIIASGADIGAHVLKVGHHGSRTSTTQEFLSAVSPRITVISAGAGNQYGHPHPETLDRLAGTDIYRTDIHGHIIINTDGTTIKVVTHASGPTTTQPPPSKTEPPPEKPPADDVIVFITKTGSKYHADGCRYLSSSKIPISLSEAKNKGYGPCSVCKPPQ